MKICPKCGSENKNEAKFCNECGCKLMPEISTVEDANDGISYNTESFSDSSDKDKEIEENRISSEIGQNDTAKESEDISQKPLKKKNLIAVGAVCFLFVVIILFGTKSHQKNKYYVEPRTNYEITNPDFDFLTEDTKEGIEQLLQENIEWYNNIKYDERKKAYEAELKRQEKLKALRKDNTKAENDWQKQYLKLQLD